MALDAEKMAKNIEDALTAKGFKPTAEHSVGHKYWLGIAEGIVKSIQEDAVVSVDSGPGAGSQGSVQ